MAGPKKTPVTPRGPAQKASRAGPFSLWPFTFDEIIGKLASKPNPLREKKIKAKPSRRSRPDVR